MNNNGVYDYVKDYGTGISDPEEFRKILDFLNFKKIVTVNKSRKISSENEIPQLFMEKGNS